MNNPCYCGWAWEGKKCRELQKKHPELSKENGWHKPEFPVEPRRTKKKGGKP